MGSLEQSCVRSSYKARGQKGSLKALVSETVLGISHPGGGEVMSDHRSSVLCLTAGVHIIAFSLTCGMWELLLSACSIESCFPLALPLGASPCLSSKLKKVAPTAIIRISIRQDIHT